MSQGLETAISTLVSRLENVAARLEKVEKQLAHGGGAAASSSASAAAPAAATASGASDAASAPSVVDYDQLVAEHVQPYLTLSKKLGDLVEKQAALVEQAIQAQRSLLVTAVQSKKPSDSDFQKLLKPTADLIQQILAVKEKAPRATPQINHITGVAEGIQALGWVAVSPAPMPFVKDAGQAAAEFWTNKILKEYKDKDHTHVDWVKAWQGFLVNLQPYIKKHHTTGLVWSGTGDAAAVASSAPSPAPAAPKAGGPPPPPPKAPPAPPALTSAAASSSSASHGPDPQALMAELNKGLDVTKGLRKVKPEEKTKNRPADERVSVVKADDAKPKGGKPKAEKAGKEYGALPGKEAKLFLDGNKWMVENQVGPKEIELKETEPKQAVYIHRCENVVVKISGKINAISVDGCDKVGVLFENAIASVECVNSRAIQVQVTGKVPSFAVDKTTGFNLYLSQQCLDAEVITSKSDSMNIVLPPVKEGDDVTEIPVPEQYKTMIKNRKLVTEPVRHE